MQRIFLNKTERTEKMKKTLTIALILTIAFSTLSLAASAFDFGSGVAVIANETKMIKSGLLGQSLSFTETDFKTALSIPSFDKITVTSLPSPNDGRLMLGDRTVNEGTSVRRRTSGFSRRIIAVSRILLGRASIIPAVSIALIAAVW